MSAWIFVLFQSNSIIFEAKVFLQKTLASKGLYQLRQALIHEGSFRSYKAVYEAMKQNENWLLLPRKVSNQVWKQITTNWSSWFKALKSYKKVSDAFTGRPKIPKYNKSVNTVTYEKGALGTRGLSKGQIRLSQTNIILDVSSLKSDIVEAKIIPKNNKFVIKVTYKEEMTENELDYNKIAGIDLGINNLITVATYEVSVAKPSGFTACHGKRQRVKVYQSILEQTSIKVEI